MAAALTSACNQPARSSQAGQWSKTGDLPFQARLGQNTQTGTLTVQTGGHGETQRSAAHNNATHMLDDDMHNDGDQQQAEEEAAADHTHTSTHTKDEHRVA